MFGRRSRYVKAETAYRLRIHVKGDDYIYILIFDEDSREWPYETAYVLAHTRARDICREGFVHTTTLGELHYPAHKIEKVEMMVHEVES